MTLETIATPPKPNKLEFLNDLQYQRLISLGWEYDEELHSFHFIFLEENGGGVAMDAFLKEEETKKPQASYENQTTDLYYSEFSYCPISYSFREKEWGDAQVARFCDLERFVLPYLREDREAKF